MSRNITAVFLRKRRQDSGRDQAPDYDVYEFTDIRDEFGEIYSNKWIKKTELISAMSPVKGISYNITLSDDIDEQLIRLPYPVEISDGKVRVYLKGGNTIIKEDSKGKEHDLSTIMPRSQRHNTLKAVLNKFQRGQLTEELLLDWNRKGTYFYIQYIPSKNIFGTHTVASAPKKNYVLIQKETQTEIDRCVESIKRNYLNSAIEKHFLIEQEIIPSKKKK